MSNRPALIVSTDRSANLAMQLVAEGCRMFGWRLLISAESTGYEAAAMPDATAIAAGGPQTAETGGFATAEVCPQDHPARRNLAVLYAIQTGAPVILELEDTTLPRTSYWGPRIRAATVAVCERQGWQNPYRYFTDAFVWPRGLPLDAARAGGPKYDTLRIRSVDCPIQLGLVDDLPDVDAVYRLLLPLPLRFRQDRVLAFAPNCLVPVGSNNLTWWPDAYPLMYLPGTAAPAVADLWRGMVAQRIAAANGWHILIHAPTATRRRIADAGEDRRVAFGDEVSIQTSMPAVAEALAAVAVTAGPLGILRALVDCYEALVHVGVVAPGERELVDAWVGDLAVNDGPADEDSPTEPVSAPLAGMFLDPGRDVIEIEIDD